MPEFLTFKWGPLYGPKHVNILQAMLRRHYRGNVRLTCITDNTQGIDPDVRCLPMWKEPRLVGDCMQRIRAFEPSMRDFIGPRFCWLDLDIVIVDDVTPIFDRTEDFIICGVEKSWQPYNGSLVMMNAGCRAQVYRKFSMIEFWRKKKQHGYGAGDQGWIACCLGPNEARWTEADGVFSYRDHCEPKNGELPEGARLVILNSRRFDPSDPKLQARSPWIGEHWRL